MSPPYPDLLAQQVADRLRTCRIRLVLAESCTGGLVAARLAGVPGISEFFCGSAVTYRERTKSDWLGIPGEMLVRHTAVSREVTEAMAFEVLARTPEADLAAAVTGHLGPAAPPNLDGTIYTCTVFRSQRANESAMTDLLTAVLTSHSRQDRQQEAADLVFRQIHAALASLPPSQ